MSRKLARIEEIGVGVVIDPTAEFIDVDRLSIGDHTFIGPDVRVVGGEFTVGEYSKIHRGTYIYPKRGVSLGHCTWIGQGTHLDGTGGIRAGDFMGVGINSALYSHIRHGDVTEGCNLDHDGFLEIGHDVWFVGMCLVSPIRAHDKSVALLGSVVTKDMEENTTYGGSPAKDLTTRMGRPWSSRTLEDRTERVRAHVDEFFSTVGKEFDKDAVEVVATEGDSTEGLTTYCVETRTYSKTNGDTEVALNKWLFGYRAKFRPIRRVSGA